MPMGIFDTRPLKVRARKLLALAHEERERGKIAFAQQLKAQAHKYLRECAAMGTHCEDETDSDDGSIERPRELQ
jgi:hypothetical protein